MNSTLISIITIIGSLGLLSYFIYSLVRRDAERKAVAREVARQNSKDVPTEGEVILEKFIEISKERQVARQKDASDAQQF